MSEMKFGELQMDERYKRLKRELKLASLKKENGKRRDQSSFPSPLRRISNISIDSASSSISTVGSFIPGSNNDIVSSSTNLRNASLEEPRELSNSKEDYHRMPPPSSSRIFHSAKKSNNMMISNVSGSPNNNGKRNSRIEPNKGKQCLLFNNAHSYVDNIGSSQSNSDNLQDSNDIVLFQWQIMLNKQGQLVIKGISENKKIIQSEPIMRKLTSTCVESVYRYKYYLKGTIKDNEATLPQYVRGKFYNGFPDDWENVCELWEKFVQQGCKASFRWPTPVTDSDDDIKSEVTDVTYLYSRRSKHDLSNLESFKESRSPETSFRSDYSFNVSESKDNETRNLHNSKRKDSFTQTTISGVNGNLFCDDNIQTLLNRYNSEKEKNTDLRCSSDKEKLIDQLMVVLNNLLDDKRPQKYVNKVIELVECLNNVLNFASVRDDEHDNTEKFKSGMLTRKRKTEISNESEESESSPLKKDIACVKDRESKATFRCTRSHIAKEADTAENNNAASCNNLSQRKRTFTEMSKDGNSDSDSFESGNEIYTGCPKIPAERLLRERKMLHESRESKVKKSIRQKYYGTGEQHVSNVRTVENRVNASKSKQTNNEYFEDSNFNMTEDETYCSKEKKGDARSNIQNKTTKFLQLDIAEKERCSLNDLSKAKTDKNKVPESPVEETSTPVHRRVKNLYDSFDKINHDEPSSADTCRIKGTTANVETWEGKGNKSDKHHVQHHTPRVPSEELLHQLKNGVRTFETGRDRTTKPRIIKVSSVDLNIKKVLKENTDTTTNETKNSEELNEENRNNRSTQKISPTELNANQSNKIDLTFTRDNQKDTAKRSKTQPCNLHSGTSNMLELELNSKEDPNRDNPKLLSNWVPKVLSTSGLALAFEGTLLNDAGYIVQKKFQTDAVLRRVTPTVIETVHHEHYKLIGDLTDTRHVVPKELKGQCRHGCPRRIEEFCKKWKLLQDVTGAETTTTNNRSEGSMDSIVGVSSKGRRIIRPLNYWAGERFTLKDDNTPVYSPSSLQASVLDSSNDSPNKSKYAKKMKTKEKDDNTNDSSEESEVLDECSIKPINKNPSNTKDIEKKRSRNSITNHRMRRSKEISEFDQSIDIENISPSKQRGERMTKQTSPSSTNRRSRRNLFASNEENSHEAYDRSGTTRVITRSRKMSVNTDSSIPKKMFTNHRLSPRKYHDVVCTYYQGIPFKDDTFFSDDQRSGI